MSRISVRNTREEDFESIQALCRAVYTDSPPWAIAQLTSHLELFPEGQFVAVEPSGRVVGMCASLIIRWDDYDFTDSWKAFTDRGLFTNHDPANGRTLYGAEVMAHPDVQGKGVGSQLYVARRKLVERLGLLRIRAGARLRGYSKYADTLTPQHYANLVIRGELFDPTLSFQLRRGFRVIAVVEGYLSHDPESLGWAAIIEWLNPKVAASEDYEDWNKRFPPPEVLSERIDIAED